MVVVALDGRGGLLEADVVEASEGRAADVFDGVVRYQELLLGGDGGTDGRSKSLVRIHSIN